MKEHFNDCKEHSCNCCAWYCHADSKCYVPSFSRPASVNNGYSCHDYAFDGLEDWERGDAND